MTALKDKPLIIQIAGDDHEIKDMGGQTQVWARRLKAPVLDYSLKPPMLSKEEEKDPIKVTAYNRQNKIWMDHLLLHGRWIDRPKR